MGCSLWTQNPDWKQASTTAAAAAAAVKEEKPPNDLSFFSRRNATTDIHLKQHLQS